MNFKIAAKLVFATFFGALLHIAAVHAAQDWIYEVKSGDSLWSICEEYVERRLCFIELGEYNGLPKHNLIDPGTQLKIPYEWLKQPPQPALVVWSRGEVSYIPARFEAKQAWQQASAISSTAALSAAGVSLQPLPEDGKLYVGDRIVTGEGSVRLRFADNSELTLMPQSDLKLEKVASGVGSKFVETELKLGRGSTLNKVENVEKAKEVEQGDPNREGRYRISTPAGVAAVRGTEFRVSAESTSGKIMYSEVLAGQVQVANDRGDSSALVNAGFGVRSERGQPVSEPRKLLEPPALTGAFAENVLQPFTLEWQALSGAVSYRLELYANSELIASENVSETRYDFSGLDEGRYEVVLSAVDEIGLRGLNLSQAINTVNQLDAVQLEQSKLIPVNRRSFALNWEEVALAASYQVEVASDVAFTDVIASAETSDAKFEYRSKKPVFVRVSAKASNGVISEPSDEVSWQPEQDNGYWWLGGFAVLAALLLL